MKRLAFTFLLTINLSIGFSQNQRIDNLKRELAIAKQDTHSVSVLVDLSSSYLYLSTDSAVIYGEKAVALAQEIKSPENEAIASSHLGFVYRESGNLSKALKLTNKALKFFEEKEDWQKIANCKNSLGLIYWDLKDFTKALQYYHQAKTIFERLNLKRRVASIHNNMGIAFTDMNQLDSAKYYLTQSYKNNANGLYPLRNLGYVEEKRGNHRLALGIYAQCWKINDSSDFRNTAILNNMMAESYQSINKSDSAIFYANKGLALAKRGPYRKRIIDSYRILKEAYKAKGDFKLALANEELMVAESDSLIGTSIRAVVSQEEENQIEIENSKKEYQNRLKQYFLLAGLGVMLLIGFILYRNNRQKHKTNKVLGNTLSKLKSTQTQLIQSEKLASLGELTAGIAHEIQNPLNFVNNFSELSIDLAKELKEEVEKVQIPEADKEYIGEIIGDLSQNQEKINLYGKRASSIVKGMLEHSKPSSGKKELTDINALANEYLKLSFHGMRVKNKDFSSDFTTDFDINLPKIEVAPQDMGRVLLNIFNNAFYAVGRTSSSSGLVVVSTNKLADAIEIRVQDNGIGMSEATKAKVFQPFFTTKPTGEGTGLGLSLAYDILTKIHGGTIEVESKEGEGSIFIMKIPI